MPFKCQNTLMSSKYYICSNMHIVYQMALKRVYGDCDGSSKVHNRLSCVLRMSCSLNGPQTSASCMEIATVLQWYTTDCLVHRKCHAPSMVHTRVPRVWKLPRSSMVHNRLSCVRRISCSLNGPHTSALCMQISTVHQWDTTDCIVYGECHSP